ncbi:MAG: sigma-70 family RNA polymerase sigma factor [Sulfurovum sp.]|nr:sigma-70 family RNA polymerase sigma factor [Sulfurovaceae bacterium]
MFKFEIIKTVPIKQGINLPRYVLASSQEQAEKIYEDFAGVLNKMSYKYSQITGIEKSDLFGEAIVGLATAYQNWGQIHNGLPKRMSVGFKTYATFSIKDALNEYIRHNSASVKIPSYLMKAINNFRRIKNDLEISGIEENIIKQVMISGDITTLKINLTKDVIDRVGEVLKNLNASAKRSSITLKELYDRSNLIRFHTINVDSINNTVANKSEEEDINAAILIDDLKSKMDKDELLISNYIMEGYSIPEIGELMDKKPRWVRYKLEKIRKKATV